MSEQSDFTRSQFVRNGAKGSLALVAGGSLLAAATGVASADDTGGPSDVDIAKLAATAELLAIDFYTRSIDSGIFGGRHERYLKGARANEVDHYNALAGVIGADAPKGLKFVYPKDTFKSRESASGPGAHGRDRGRRAGWVHREVAGLETRRRRSAAGRGSPPCVRACTQAGTPSRSSARMLSASLVRMHGGPGGRAVLAQLRRPRALRPRRRRAPPPGVDVVQPGGARLRGRRHLARDPARRPGELRGGLREHAGRRAGGRGAALAGGVGGGERGAAVGVRANDEPPVEGY